METRKTIAEVAIAELWQLEKERHAMTQQKQPAANPPAGHWPDLHQPPSFEEAMAAVKVAIDRLRGATTDNLKAAYAAEVAILFGTAQIPHDEHPPLGALPMSNEDAATALESFVKTHGQRGATGAGVIPWGQLVSILLPLLLQWLQNR